MKNWNEVISSIKRLGVNDEYEISPLVIKFAVRVAKQMEKDGAPILDRVTPNLAGGILLERHDSKEFETIEISSKFLIECSIYENCKLMQSRQFRLNDADEWIKLDKPEDETL